MSESQLGTVEIKGFAGTGSAGLQLTSGVRRYLNGLTISFLLFSVPNFTQNITGAYYRCYL